MTSAHLGFALSSHRRGGILRLVCTISPSSRHRTTHCLGFIVPARKYLDTTLRVLVTLTHMDELWARKVVQGEYTVSCLLRTLAAAGRDMQSSQAPIVKKEEDDDELALDGADASGSGRESDAQALDTLCLALGLLTNMVQSIDETKDIIRETRESDFLVLTPCRANGPSCPRLGPRVRAPETCVRSEVRLHPARQRYPDPRYPLFAAAGQD